MCTQVPKKCMFCDTGLLTNRQKCDTLGLMRAKDKKAKAPSGTQVKNKERKYRKYWSNMCTKLYMFTKIPD